MKRTAFAVAVLLLVASAIYLNFEHPILDNVAQEPVTTARSEIAANISVAAPSNVHNTSRASRGALSVIYNAPDLDTQESMHLTTVGPLKLDAALLYRHGFNLCNYLNDSKHPTFAAQATSRGGRTSPQDLASAKMVDAFRTSYCSKGTDAAERERSYDYIEMALARAAASGDRDAADLLDVLTTQEEDLNASDLSVLEGRLTDILRRTDSPALFLETAKTLHDSAFGTWMPAGYGGPRYNEEELGQIRLYGSAIAMCREFDVCRPGSIYTIIACMPTDCHPQGEVDGRLKRILTDDQYYWATQYADALRAMRRGG